MQSAKVSHQFMNLPVSLSVCTVSCIYCRVTMVQTKRWHSATPHSRNLGSYVVMGEDGWICHMTPPPLDLHFPSHLSPPSSTCRMFAATTAVLFTASFSAL